MNLFLLTLLILFFLYLIIRNYIGFREGMQVSGELVIYNGKSYRTLTGLNPNGWGVSCERKPTTVPSGWRIAPDNADTRAIIRRFPWNTHVVFTDSGKYYGSANYNPGFWSPSNYYCPIQNGDKINVPACSLAILLEKGKGGINFQCFGKEGERRRKAAEEEAKKKAAEEAERKRKEAEEAERKRKEAEARRKAEEEAARLKKEEEAKKRAAEEAERKRRAAAARRKAEEEAARKRKEAEEARRAAEKAKSVEKARKEAEAKRKAEELRQAEENARRKAEDERQAMLASRHKKLIGNQRSMLRSLGKHNTEHKNRRPILKQKEKDIKPELMKRIKELEENISKLQFQTKRTQLRGQNLVAVDKLDMGKLSMDLFNWQKINKRSPVDINLILGDHIKNAAKETTIKHVVPPKEEPKSCDPIPEIEEKEQVEYKGYPVFKKPEFPQVPSEKYSLPKGAKGGPQIKVNSSISNVNDNVPKSYNSWDYDQRADTGIEKTH
jgi:hypothetical protein